MLFSTASVMVLPRFGFQGRDGGLSAMDFMNLNRGKL